MSRTYRRKTGETLWKWSTSFGEHRYQRRYWYDREGSAWILYPKPTLEEMIRDYHEELEEDRVRERKYHSDCYGYNWKRSFARKEYTRSMGLRSGIRQECHRVKTSGDYDSFDDSKQVRKWKCVAWIVD